MSIENKDKNIDNIIYHTKILKVVDYIYDIFLENILNGQIIQAYFNELEYIDELNNIVSYIKFSPSMNLYSMSVDSKCLLDIDYNNINYFYQGLLSITPVNPNIPVKELINKDDIEIVLTKFVHIIDLLKPNKITGKLTYKDNDIIKKYDNKDCDECCICYDLTDNKTCCGHSVCFICVEKIFASGPIDYITRQCPICREDIIIL
jgi:hypothetical protein